jgi:hypothetical protein
MEFQFDLSIQHVTAEEALPVLCGKQWNGKK